MPTISVLKPLPQYPFDPSLPSMSPPAPSQGEAGQKLLEVVTTIIWRWKKQPPHGLAFPLDQANKQNNQPTPKNEAAIHMLRSWREADEQEQQETWDYLKRVLDEDRLSGRKLFI